MKNFRGDSILNVAINSENLDLEVIKLLIEKKGEVNQKDKILGNTILHNLLKNKNIKPELVEYILKHTNADPNMRNNKTGRYIILRKDEIFFFFL